MTRATAVQNIAVVHRLSDLEAAGGRDSEQVRLARGLLSDSETKVIFRQPPAEPGLVRELCQLSEGARDHVHRRADGGGVMPLDRIAWAAMAQ